MRCKGPGFDELGLPLFVLGLRHLRQSKVFTHVWPDRGFDLRRMDLHPVLEDAVQKEALPITLCEGTLEVDQYRIDPVNLLVSVGISVPHRDDQYEQLGVFLSNLRQDLNEIEGPVS